MRLAPSGVPYPPGTVPKPPAPVLVLSDDDRRVLNDAFSDVKRAVGRPTRYKKDHAHQARMLAGREWTHEQIAEFMQIDISTLYRWKAKHPDFRDAIAWAKANMKDLVERALLSRAIGYTHNDVHISNFQGTVTKTKIKKHYPPDVSAGKFWLQTQDQAKWSLDYQGDELPEEDEDPMSAEEAARIDAVLSESIDEH